jgi:hypothetical protein
LGRKCIFPIPIHSISFLDTLRWRWTPQGVLVSRHCMKIIDWLPLQLCQPNWVWKSSASGRISVGLALILHTPLDLMLYNENLPCSDLPYLPSLSYSMMSLESASHGDLKCSPGRKTKSLRTFSET